MLITVNEYTGRPNYTIVCTEGSVVCRYCRPRHTGFKRTFPSSDTQTFKLQSLIRLQTILYSFLAFFTRIIIITQKAHSLNISMC